MSRSFTLLDGGMGKALQAAGAPFRQPEWSALALIEAPEIVEQVHHDFVAAGADVIIVSNYAVVPAHLGDERFAAVGAELTTVAARAARRAADAADRAVAVAGSIPPLFGSYEPDNFDAQRAPALWATIVDALAPHIDLLVAETVSSLEEGRVAAAAAGRVDVPLWMSYTLIDEDHTMPARLRSGESITAATEQASAVGASAVLFNCSHPEVMAGAITQALGVAGPEMEVGAYANAFVPKPSVYASNSVILDHRADLDPAGYVPFVTEWLDLGASIVGGCCGIMPPHIEAMATLRP